MPRYTALVTLLAILFYFYAGSRVSRARQEFGVAAPAMSGHPDFDRIFRVQMNTLEWMPIFLPLLWLFAFYVNDIAAAALGLVWIAGRILYLVNYTEAAGKRGAGFAVQGAACVVLLRSAPSPASSALSCTADDAARCTFTAGQRPSFAGGMSCAPSERSNTAMPPRKSAPCSTTSSARGKSRT
jgi:glutathione S-transferase